MRIRQTGSGHQRTVVRVCRMNSAPPPLPDMHNEPSASPIPRDNARSWTFTTEVRSVTGEQGDWLRSKIAAVVRDLLLWAQDDLRRNDGEEEAA